MDDELEILRGLSVNRVFSTAAAEKAGIPRLRLVARARDNDLVHLARGSWTAAQPADAQDLHLLRTIGIIGRHRATSAATAHSALIAWGLPVVGADLARVHLVRGTSRTTRRTTDYSVWSSGHDLVEVTRDPVLEEAIWCVEPAVAIVHAGLVGSPETALVAGDAAVARHLVTPRQLEVAAADLPLGTRGSAGVRRALADVDGRHESPGETRTAQVCRALGYALDPQVWIGPWRVDFIIRGTKVVIEFDGAVKYESKQDLLAEKRREDDLRRRGWVIVRLMWDDLYHPKRVRERIEAALRLPAA